MWQRPYSVREMPLPHVAYSLQTVIIKHYGCYRKQHEGVIYHFSIKLSRSSSCPKLIVSFPTVSTFKSRLQNLICCDFNYICSLFVIVLIHYFMHHLYCLCIVCIMYYYGSISDNLGPSAFNRLTVWLMDCSPINRCSCASYYVEYQLWHKEYSLCITITQLFQTINKIISVAFSYSTTLCGLY